MDSVLQIVLTSFEKVGKSQNEAKNFQPLQKITKHLDFCFADEERTHGTLAYLDAIRTKLPNMKKGKKDLMPFICETLIHIFEEILTGQYMFDEIQLLENSQHWEKRKKEFKSLNNELSNRFWGCFQEIYDNLLKMASKKEASSFDLVNCMAMMTCRAKEDIYFQNVPELIKLYTAGLKDKKEKFDFFKSIKSFVTYVPNEYVTKDLEKFSNFIKSVSDQIFNKKVVLNEYRQDAETFLVEYAKKQLHRTWPKLMEEILKPENQKVYTNEHRAVALSCIARVARLFPDEIAKQNYLLGVVCTNIILDEKMRTDVTLLRNVLKCFPRVRHTSEEKMNEIRNIIGTHCLLHPDRTVSRNAAEALVSSVEMEPGKILDVVEKFRDVLIKVNEITPENAYKLLKDLFLVLETFIHKVQESEKLIIGLDIQGYNSLRKKVEGMLLLYIIHTAPTVRNQAVKTLKQLSRPELKAITKEISSNCTYLIDDGMLTSPKNDSSEWLPCVEEMCKNHVDDAITKAWEELIKRWSTGVSRLDKIDLLSNHLRFLCAAARPTLASKAEPFFNELLQLLTKNCPHNEIKTAVLGALELVHPTSMYMILSQIRSIDVARTYIKKEHRIESSDPAYEQHIISLLKRLITKSISNVSSISPTDFLFVKQGIAVRDFFDELISNWTTKDRIDVRDITGSFLNNIDTWKDAAEIIATYLKHLNTISKQTALEKGTDISDQAVTYSNMFKKHTVNQSLVYLFKFLHYDHIGLYCQEAANGIQHICSFGMIEDEKFINDILRYCEQVIVRKKDEVDVIPVMSEFLRNNPQTLRTFIINSYYESFNRYIKEELDTQDESEDKSKKSSKGTKKEVEAMLELKEEKKEERKKFTERIPNICRAYLSAIVKVMEDHLDHWIQEQYTTLGGMFYIALVHSCTRGNISLRDKAHELINIVIKSDTSEGNINYGTTYHCTSVGDECVFKKTIYNFSEYVSKTAPLITADLFTEADKTVDLLDGVNKENTLRILTPWSYNFGLYVKTCLDSANTSDAAYKMKDFTSQRLLKIIFTITEKLHGDEDSQTDDYPMTNNLNKHYLERIWYNLIKSSEVCKWVIPEVVKFIVENYDYSFSNNTQPVNTTHTLLRAVFVYICRDEKSLPLILENLVYYLRDYKEKVPETKKEVAKYLVERGLQEPVDAEFTSLEFSALQLLVDITYEHDVALIPHLPKLFMNTIVLFNSCQNTRTFIEPKLILENILQSLALRMRDLNTSTIHYVEKLTQFLIENLRKSSQQKLTRVRSFIVQWTEYVSKKHRPDLAEAISEMALNWALQTKDNKISLESYYVFEALNKNFSCDVIEKLVIGFFDAVRVRDDAKISIIMDIFFNIPSDKLAPPRVSKLLFQVVFWLFFSWNKTHFARGLKYMLKLQGLTQYDNIDESVLNSSMYNVWKGYTGEETVDVSVSRVIFKGIFDTETFAETFDLLNNLVVRFESYMTKQSNMMIATILVVQGILYLSGDFSKKAQLQKLLDRNEGLVDFKNAFNTLEQSFTQVKANLVTNEEVISELTEYNKCMTQFTTDFASAYQKIFSNKSGSFINWVLVSLTKNSNIKWSLASVLLTSKLLPVIFQPGLWSIEEISSVSCIAKECMSDVKLVSYLRNPLLHNSAKDITEFIAFHAHEKQKKYTKKEVETVFPYLEPTLGFLKSVRSEKPSNNESFVGTNTVEKDITRSEILCRMWYQTFSLQIDPASNNEEASLLTSILEFKSETHATESNISPVIANYAKVISQRKTKPLSDIPESDAPPTVTQVNDINIDDVEDEVEEAIIIPPPPESDSEDEESEKTQ
ncbi:predicted protein [Naegleria gruberi]|uniref:Predicted protein n=1 Tax=Naegleria gruberi TaxID=5762 RepID=D2VRN9_NAEGR|nr:uncharacterized protein NAEGRDRAFT_80993 [Naegleria gruberi]EFC40426.1 predicted protein [Naegleria gruberi]|eukprot:XP_002673170.1 predicted protein [Naegleria gruberi strain NEG-M]